MKMILYCWSCGKEHSNVPLTGEAHKCDCGGYVVTPSGKMRVKQVADESDVYGTDCRDGRCEA